MGEEEKKEKATVRENEKERRESEEKDAGEHRPDCCMERKGEERERKRERGGCR